MTSLRLIVCVRRCLSTHTTPIGQGAQTHIATKPTSPFVTNPRPCLPKILRLLLSLPMGDGGTRWDGWWGRWSRTIGVLMNRSLRGGPPDLMCYTRWQESRTDGLPTPPHLGPPTEITNLSTLPVFYSFKSFRDYKIDCVSLDRCGTRDASC